MPNLHRRRRLPIRIRIQLFLVRVWGNWRWAVPPVAVFLVTRTVQHSVAGDRGRAAGGASCFPPGLPRRPCPRRPLPATSAWSRTGMGSGIAPSPKRATRSPSLRLRDMFSRTNGPICRPIPCWCGRFMSVSSWDFPLSATIVSLSCSGLAVVLVYRLVMGFGGTFAAFTAVLGLCAFPVSPVLQVAYAESLALLLLAIALILLETEVPMAGSRGGLSVVDPASRACPRAAGRPPLGHAVAPPDIVGAVPHGGAHRSGCHRSPCCGPHGSVAGNRWCCHGQLVCLRRDLRCMDG